MPESSGPSREFVALQRAVAGRYSLVRELGRGGMAVVFLARDVELGRLVAIKLLRGTFVADPAARARFLGEARMAARLLHPNIVPVHAVEEVDELVFLVMAFVDGETLGHRVRRAGPLSPAGVREVVRGVAWALAHAHAAGVIHLDVKPDNILLERGSGRAMLTDFGIARLARESAADGPRGAADGPRGAGPAGTPRYMSPEQTAGDPVDARSDLYSLGVTAHFALTGRWPKRGEGSSARGAGRAEAVLRALPGAEGPPSLTGVSPTLAAAIDRCLSPDPTRRPSDAATLATEIEEAEALPFHLPVAGRRLVHALRRIVLLAGVGGLALVFWPDRALVVSGILAPFLLWGLLRPARALRRAGYDSELLSDVVLEEVQGLFTERGAKPEPRWRALPGSLRDAAIRISPALCGLTGATLGAAWVAQPGLALGGPMAALGLAAAILLGAGPAAAAGSPLRHLDWGERLLVGRFGRILLRVAGVGIPIGEKRRPLDRPTEVVLASAVEEMFRLLPDEARERLEDLPGIARRLERHVEALRRRDAALAEAIGRIALPSHDDARGPAREALQGELEEARARLDGRLREAVAALEHLRLRLHRLAMDATWPAATQPALLGALEEGLTLAREVERTEVAASSRDAEELARLRA